MLKSLVRTTTKTLVIIQFLNILSINQNINKINSYYSLTLGSFYDSLIVYLIKENKIRIHHEETDDIILLTAKPKELQKFVTKYVNSVEAFDGGMEAVLIRKQ